MINQNLCHAKSKVKGCVTQSHKENQVLSKSNAFLVKSTVQPYKFNSDEAQREALRINDERMRDIGWMYELLGLCQHKNSETRTTGSMWFDGFEVCDDIRDETVCVDCGALVVIPTHTLTEAEWESLKVEF